MLQNDCMCQLWVYQFMKHLRSVESTEEDKVSEQLLIKRFTFTLYWVIVNSANEKKLSSISCFLPFSSSVLF